MWTTEPLLPPAICDFKWIPHAYNPPQLGELRIARPARTGEELSSRCTVLSRRYKRKAIKRSFPSTTSDETRDVPRSSCSLFLSPLPELFENSLYPSWTVLLYSGRLQAQASYVHRRFYSINWNCNSHRKVGGFSSTVPCTCVRECTGWPESRDGTISPTFPSGKSMTFSLPPI